ncbi:MAG: hypothetical protein DRP71_07015 [Verrucomicrobia bacterium]|nr:MAG: hypothetical protein DRP71_07015 [Verrucomicrobiota bacterium]
MVAIAAGLHGALFLQTASPAEPAPAAIDQPAPASRLASAGMLLDLARVGARVVAVGDRGIVVLSDDEGATWRQAVVPVQSMLTSVAFADPNNGWAGGHGGVLLVTHDGGESWNRVEAPTTKDDSFLDLLAVNRRHIIAVGAYGLYCESTDGGASWEIRLVLEEDMHINRLTRTSNGRILLAGESGTLAHSEDDGRTWAPIDSPYEGSLYGFFELSNGRWLIHGLRGHVFVSDDQAVTWRQVAIEHEVLLMSGLESESGKIVLSGLGGWVFVSDDGGETFATEKPDSLTATAELLESGPEHLIYAGADGVRRLPMP